jgi:hypothetical protein
MVEAFLPTSSLSHIYPISNDRGMCACVYTYECRNITMWIPQLIPPAFSCAFSANVCVDILKQLSQAGEAKVNMTEFFLNET